MLVELSVVTHVFPIWIEMSGENIEELLFVSSIQKNRLLCHSSVVYVVVMVRHENLTQIFGGYGRTIRLCHAADNQMTRFYTCKGRALTTGPYNPKYVLVTRTTLRVILILSLT